MACTGQFCIASSAVARSRSTSSSMALATPFFRHGKDLRANSRAETAAYTTSIYNIAHRLILLFIILMAFRLQPQYSQLSPSVCCYDNIPRLSFEEQAMKKRHSHDWLRRFRLAGGPYENRVWKSRRRFDSAQTVTGRCETPFPLRGFSGQYRSHREQPPKHPAHQRTGN